MAVMMINTEKIKALNPCKELLDNYLKHYADFNGSLEDFVMLEKITYSNKVWVFTRLATKRQSVVWAILCSSKVLSIFEEKYPDDKRPRLAIEAAENWVNNPCEESVRSAASAALSAESAAESASWFAAWSASSAASAARSASSAAWSASSAALSAESAAWSASWSEEEEINLILMVEAASWL